MIELRNLMPNPKPSSQSGWAAMGCSTQWDGTSVRMESTKTNPSMDFNGTGPGAGITLAAGSYVATARILGITDPAADFPYKGTAPGETYGRAMSVIITPTSGSQRTVTAFVPATDRLRRYLVQFTVTEASRVQTRLWGATGTPDVPNGTRWTQIGLFSADDWSHMQQMTPPVDWFDGDSKPK